jgi:hypothetical protein
MVLLGIKYYTDISLVIEYDGDKAIELSYKSGEILYHIRGSVIRYQFKYITPAFKNYLSNELKSIIEKCNNTMDDFETIYYGVCELTNHRCTFNLCGPILNIYMDNKFKNSIVYLIWYERGNIRYNNSFLCIRDFLDFLEKSRDDDNGLDRILSLELHKIWYNISDRPKT